MSTEELKVAPHILHAAVAPVSRASKNEARQSQQDDIKKVSRQKLIQMAKRALGLKVDMNR